MCSIFKQAVVSVFDIPFDIGMRNATCEPLTSFLRSATAAVESVNQMMLVGGRALPSKKRWSSSVGMIIPFPTEWKNNPNVPNHQPGCLCVLVVFLLGGLCRNIGDSPYRVDKYFRQGARGPQKNPSFMGQIGIAPIEDGDITI